MPNYKLLTPGPLTTTDTVKKEMMFDHCTWDEDYKKITQEIRSGLLKLARVSEDPYTCVLMQGSGTFGVESVLTSSVGADDRLLIASNGAYGERMADIAEHAGLSYILYSETYDQVPSADKIQKLLNEHPEITHVSMVHSETTSGILNDIASVAGVVKASGRTFIVDAMSSFGGVDIPAEELGIDFIISSANKCIQGVPGFSFIICRRDCLAACEGKAKSLSLDLYDQWKTMEKDGKWRFTSPTHVVLAFAQAMREMEAEGGIEARHQRYTSNNRLLIELMAEMGIRPYIDSRHQGPIITTFFYPENHAFSFDEMYHYIKERGYAIYPGKVTDADTFRIGNIGEIYEEDIRRLCAIIGEFLNKKIQKREKSHTAFDAVIFDWAGTTVDYGCFAPVQAFMDAFEEFGIVPTMDEVRAPMGMLKIDHVRTMLQMERLTAEWERIYGRPFTEEDVYQVYQLSEKKILENVPRFTDVKPYVTETVETLRGMGIKIGSTTGYTDEMMEIVAAAAATKGYKPDCWFSPDSVDRKGRPNPYMIFRNMQFLGLTDVRRVMKVGDTVSDIREGKNAGLFTVGVIEGSSAMGLSREEFKALSPKEKEERSRKVRQMYLEAGADAVVTDIRGVLEYI